METALKIAFGVLLIGSMGVFWAVDPELGFGWALLLLAVGVYFLPASVASKRVGGGGPQVLNFFLGWTGLGWIIALAWAASLPRKPADGAERFEQLSDGTFRKVAS